MEGEPTTAGCRAVADRAVPAARDAACLAGARAAGARIVGPDQPARVGPGRDRREPVVRDAGEPARPGPCPRWFVERLCRRGGDGRGGRGLRQRHRRLGAHPRGLLRDGRPEDDMGPHPARGGLAARAELRHGRADGPHGGRSGYGDAAARTGLHRRRSTQRRSERGPARHRGGSVDHQCARPRRWVSWGGTAGIFWSRGGTTPPCRPGSSWWSRRGAPTRAWWRRTRRGSATTYAAGWSSDRPSTRATVRAAWMAQRTWKAALERIFTEVDVLVTPTLTIFPPRLDEGDDLLVSRCTLPVNLAGVPALSHAGAHGRAVARQHPADRAGAQRGAAAGVGSSARGSDGVRVTPSSGVGAHEAPADVGQKPPHAVGRHHLDPVTEAGQLARHHQL